MLNMNTLQIELLKALNRYFKRLSQVGAINKSTSSSLSILKLIEMVVNGEMSKFITRDDLKIINQSLLQLKKQTCLMDLNLTINNSIFRTIIPVQQ